MATPLDISNFFIDMAQHTGITDLTNMKLNKLVYFAQAWALGKLGRPLFKEDIQAWVYGPVIPTVYHAFKRYGRNPITKQHGTYDLSAFTQDELEILGDVYLKYGNINPTELMRISHEYGAPWQKRYDETLRSIIIPQELMKVYFGARVDELKMPPVNLDKIPRIGHFDADGVTVLPADMDCPEDDEAYGRMWAGSA